MFVFFSDTRDLGGPTSSANMKSISERDLIFHKSVEKVKDISFDDNKVSF